MNDINITGPYKTFDNMAEYYMVVVENETFMEMFQKEKQYIEWFIHSQGYTAEHIKHIMKNIDGTFSLSLKIYHYKELIAFKLEFG